MEDQKATGAGEIAIESERLGGWEEPSPWRKLDDLYAGHDHTKMAPEPQTYNSSMLQYIKSEKQDQNQVIWIYITKTARTVTVLTDLKICRVLQDDANKENKNLFTSDGLQPSYKDLEQIFDNSDDTSGDETVRDS